MTGTLDTPLLGQRIRQARKAAGFRNIEQLAVALGVGARTVQRWEAGDTEPSLASLRRIAALTAHPLAFFLARDEVAA